MAQIKETTITRLIVDTFAQDFRESLELDVAIAGAGPSGIQAATTLATAGYKVALFERDLHVGGGMWGGGMLFPRIVVQEDAKHFLTAAGVNLLPHEDGLYTADSVETVSKCTAAAVDAGARIWVGVAVEDVVIREDDRVSGVVINWGAVEMAGLHVDPLALQAKVVIDATGHPAEITRRVLEKIPGAKLCNGSECVPGEKPMWAAIGEGSLVPNTQEVYPGLITSGMASNAVFAGPRMGAIFGGMYLSGQKAAKLAMEFIESAQ